MKFLPLIVSAFILVGCAGGEVDYLPQTAIVYAAVPVASVRVSTRPPLGRYEVLGIISGQQTDPSETLAHAAARFQAKAAEVGGNYVWVIGMQENNYMAPGFS